MQELTINKSVAKDNAVSKIGVILEINVSNGKKIRPSVT